MGNRGFSSITFGISREVGSKDTAATHSLGKYPSYSTYDTGLVLLWEDF